MAKVNTWIVTYNRNTKEITAFEDSHTGMWMHLPDYLKLLGQPVAATAGDAIDYVSQLWTQEALDK